MNPNDDIATRLRSHWHEVADTQPAVDQLQTVLSATETIRPRPAWSVRLAGAADALHWPQVSVAGRIAFALLLVLLTVALGAGLAVVGGPGPATPRSLFEGRWVATDAADGSEMLLVVSAGHEPSVRYEDAYASACASRGDTNVHWVGLGKGLIARDTLVVRFETSGCTTWTISPYVATFEYDEPSKTFVDPDGNIWHRP